MQDIHSITTTAAARLLGDRRLRPHSHHPNNQQALKCPRCDSLNTKFCYYNNYNLSQPRHFCKNCRRYWTKGGVLRNVPVGGGCRKSKRSSKPKAVNKLSVGKRVQSQSSSESSNTTTTNKCYNVHGDVDNTVAATASGATGISSSGCRGVFQISDGENFSIRNSDPLVADSVHHDELARFEDLMNNNNDNNYDHRQQQFSFNGVGNETALFGQFSLQTQSTEGGGGVEGHEWGFEKMGGSLDETVRIDELVENRGSSCGVATLDWNQTAENGHEGFYDLSSTIDHQTYWSDHTNDHSLFLP